MKVNKSDISDKCNTVSTHLNVPVDVCIFYLHNLFSQISVNRIPIFLQLFFIHWQFILPTLELFLSVSQRLPNLISTECSNLGIIKPAQNKNSSNPRK